MKRRYLGIELAKQYCDLAHRRPASPGPVQYTPGRAQVFRNGTSAETHNKLKTRS
jgi:hypothetical protein